MCVWKCVVPLTKKIAIEVERASARVHVKVAGCVIVVECVRVHEWVQRASALGCVLGVFRCTGCCPWVLLQEKGEDRAMAVQS